MKLSANSHLHASDKPARLKPASGSALAHVASKSSDRSSKNDSVALSGESWEGSGNSHVGGLLAGLMDNYGAKKDYKNVAFDEDRDGKVDARVVFDKNGNAAVRGRFADKVAVGKGESGRPKITYDSDGDGVSNYTIKDNKKKADSVNGDGFSGVVTTRKRDGSVRTDDEVGNPNSGRYAAPTVANNPVLYPYVDTGGGVRDRGEANRTGEVAKEQRRSVRKSLDKNEWINFGNSKGAKEALKISGVTGDGVPAGKNQFLINDGAGHSLKVTFDGDRKQRSEALARIADYYTQTPKNLRDSVTGIDMSREIRKHPFEDGNVPAEFDQGTIRIRPTSDKDLDSLDNLNQAIFNHEFGHGIDAARNQPTLEREPLRIQPSAFDTAAQQAPGTSDYATNNLDEDFAEFYGAYFNARERGPQALAALKSSQPGRFAAMDSIYRGVA